MKKKKKPVILVFILTLMIFLGLLGYFIVCVIKSKPETVSEREVYQHELILQEREEEENK